MLDCIWERIGWTDNAYSDPADRPTAETLLRAPFCFTDPHYNFLDTELYQKIAGAFQNM